MTPAKLPSGLSPAGADLNLGSSLADQVAGESEELRKKRMLEAQQRAMVGPSGSLAVTSLLGAGRGSY